jgi:hypothetical protein
MKPRACGAWLVLLLLSGAPDLVGAQNDLPEPTSSTIPVRFSTGVLPDTVTIGDRFEAVLRVRAPEGSQIVFPVMPVLSDAVQATDSVRVITGADGEKTALYGLVAWQVARLSAVPLPVRVVLPDGREALFRISLRLPEVQSVLPTDTAGIEPRGAKDVAGGWNLWLLALVGAAALTVLALGWLLSRRTGRVSAPAPPASADPREEALAALARAEALRDAEPKPFYAAVSDALRHYLAALSPRWGTDLTTEELLAQMRLDERSSREVDELRGLLRQADLVKFARVRPSAREAENTLVTARRWIERFSPRGRDDAMEREVA